MKLRIAELNQRFRKELSLDPFQGEFTLDKLRTRKKSSLARFSFDMGNRAVTGNLAAMIAQDPVMPTNAYALNS